MKYEQDAEMKLIGNDETQVIDLLKKNNGRMTQKDIIKNIPLSKEKVSIMIAELVVLNKVKKDRGNIITLCKDLNTKR